MSNLVHMRAFNNSGPYNTGEDFYVQANEVGKHKRYAAPVPAERKVAAPVPEKVEASEPDSTGPDQDATEGEQEAPPGAGSPEGSQESESQESQEETVSTDQQAKEASKDKVVKPASTRKPRSNKVTKEG